jgi:hypothetical protein
MLCKSMSKFDLDIAFEVKRGSETKVLRGALMPEIDLDIDIGSEGEVWCCASQCSDSTWTLKMDRTGYRCPCR